MIWLSFVAELHRHYYQGERGMVVDVGSRDGDDAAWLASIVGTDSVVCIEPRPAAAQAIRAKYPSFDVRECAASDRNGFADMVEFIGTQDIEGSSTLGLERAQHVDWGHRVIRVRTRRLDETLPLGPISILKIDTEGHSVPVLRGMGDRLADVRIAHIETETPERTAECGEPSNSGEVEDMMRSLGFRLAARQYQWGMTIEDQIWFR